MPKTTKAKDSTVQVAVRLDTSQIVDLSTAVEAFVDNLAVAVRSFADDISLACEEFREALPGLPTYREDDPAGDDPFPDCEAFAADCACNRKVV